MPRSGTVKKAGGELATDGRRLYVARGNALTSYDSAKGKMLWSRPQASSVHRPIRAGGLVHAGLDDGNPMAVLSSATGAKAASGVPFQYAHDHPAIAGAMLYFTDGASMLAYGL